LFGRKALIKIKLAENSWAFPTFCLDAYLPNISLSPDSDQFHSKCRFNGWAWKIQKDLQEMNSLCQIFNCYTNYCQKGQLQILQNFVCFLVKICRIWFSDFTDLKLAQLTYRDRLWDGRQIIDLMVYTFSSSHPYTPKQKVFFSDLKKWVTLSETETNLKINKIIINLKTEFIAGWNFTWLAVDKNIALFSCTETELF